MAELEFYKVFILGDPQSPPTREQPIAGSPNETTFEALMPKYALTTILDTSVEIRGLCERSLRLDDQVVTPLGVELHLGILDEGLYVHGVRIHFVDPRTHQRDARFVDYTDLQKIVSRS